MKGYTTINTDARYQDYADIGCGEAAIAALGIPVDYYMIGLGTVVKLTGSVMVLAGKLMKLTGNAMTETFGEELRKDKKTVETYLWMNR